MDSDSGKVTRNSLRGALGRHCFDAASGRIYVPGGDGHIFVFKQNSADQ